MDSAISTSRGRDPASLCLEAFARKAWEDYGVELNFCRIEGRRWSFLAGSGHELLAASERIMLTEGMGVSAEGLAGLTTLARARLLQRMRSLARHLQAPGAG